MSTNEICTVICTLLILQAESNVLMPHFNSFGKDGATPFPIEHTREWLMIRYDDVVKRGSDEVVTETAKCIVNSNGFNYFP